MQQWSRHGLAGRVGCGFRQEDAEIMSKSRLANAKRSVEPKVQTETNTSKRLMSLSVFALLVRNCKLLQLVLAYLQLDHLCLQGVLMLVVWVSTSNSQPQPALELRGTSLLGYSIVQVCSNTCLFTRSPHSMITHCVTFRHTRTIQTHSRKGLNMTGYATALLVKTSSGNPQASSVCIELISTAALNSPTRFVQVCMGSQQSERLMH